VREDAPELGGVAFHFDKGSAKRRFFFPFCECLLEETPKAVLLPLDPQKILNLLSRPWTWDLSIQKRTT